MDRDYFWLDAEHFARLEPSSTPKPRFGYAPMIENVINVVCSCGDKLRDFG